MEPRRQGEMELATLGPWRRAFQSKIVTFSGEADGIVEVGARALGGRDAGRLDLPDVVVVRAE